MPFSAARSENYTDASTIARDDIKRTVVGMAYFAGTGPDGSTCGGCDRWRASPAPRCKATICLEYKRLTGDQRKNLPSLTPACKYFVART